MIEKILEIVFNKLAKKRNWHGLLKRLTLYWRVEETARTMYGWTDKDSVLKTLLNISDFYFNKTRSKFILISKECLSELKSSKHQPKISPSLNEEEEMKPCKYLSPVVEHGNPTCTEETFGSGPVFCDGSPEQPCYEPPGS